MFIPDCGMLFQIGGEHGHGWSHGVCVRHRWNNVPEKEAGGIWCG